MKETFLGTCESRALFLVSSPEPSMFSIAEGQNLTPPFDFGVRLGLVFVVQSACLSAIAVTCLLLYIAASMKLDINGATADELRRSVCSD